MDEPDFYSWWQEEKGWTTASADMVGQDSDQATEIDMPPAQENGGASCGFTAGDTREQSPDIECV